MTDEQRRILERNQRLRERFLTETRFNGEIAAGDPENILTEEGFELYAQPGKLWRHPVIDEGFIGHPDRVHYFPQQRVAVIFDSKFGRNPVPHAAINLQLRAYAVMVWQRMACVRVFVAITQPWCAAPEDFHVAMYEAGELRQSLPQILGILAATLPLKAPRNPSPEACAYCLAKAHCRPALEVVPSIAAAKVLQLPPADLEAMAPAVKLAKSVCEAWTTRMKEIAAQDPDALQHHMLGKQSFTTRITAPREAFQLLWRAGYLGDDQKQAFDGFVACMTIGMEKLRELVMAHCEVTSEKASAIIEETLEPVILKEPASGR